MKIGKRMYVVGIAALLFGAFAMPAAANGPGVAMSLMKLDWDPRDPDKTPYKEFNVDSTVNAVFVAMWSKMRERMQPSLVESLSRPNAIASGYTLYEVDLKLQSADPDASVIAKGPASGTLHIVAPKNLLTFKARNPITPGYADPKLQVVFDIVLDMDFGLNREDMTPISIPTSVVKLANAEVGYVNVAGGLALGITEAAHLIRVFPVDSLRDRIVASINGVTSDDTLVARQLIQKNTKAFFTDYRSNGGRVENGRIMIAMWRMKDLPQSNITVRAHWDPRYGRLVPNCEPLKISVTMPSMPPPYGERAHMDGQFRPKDAPASRQQPLQYGSEFECTQTITWYQGVAGTMQFKEAVVDPGHSRTPGYSRSILAVPVNLPKPLVVGDAGRTIAVFRLEVKEAMNDGSRQRDPGQEALLKKPGDPVERSGSAKNGAASRIQNIPAAARATSAGRAADELNPQPLPPGPPPEIKVGNVPKELVTVPAAKSQPVTASSALKANATRVDPSSTTNAPQSGLH